MKVLVCGSRSIDSYEAVRKAIDGFPLDIDDIIHGGAKGVDSNADRYAVINGLGKEVVEPNYGVYGDKAPLKRNTAMVEMADAVIAVWDGESRGTKHTINEAKQHGMEEVGRVSHSSDVVRIYLVEPDEF